MRTDGIIILMIGHFGCRQSVSVTRRRPQSETNELLEKKNIIGNGEKSHTVSFYDGVKVK